MKALIWNGSQVELVSSRPEPHLRDDYILIKTAAVALNPTDAKAIVQGRAAENGLLGCDFAGTILQIGSQVAKSFQPGDRVFGCVHGANWNNPEDGAFAEVIVAKGDTVMRIPDHLSFEEACTLGVSVLTCGQGLFQEMKLSLPSIVPGPASRSRGESVLIYGGSSSAGIVGIQLCALAGYNVITTCSPSNADLCRSLSATAVFDYRDADCGEQIYQHTDGKLRLVWDTIGSPSGVSICMKTLTQDPETPKQYGTILFNEIPRKDVQYSSSFLMTFLGESFDKFGKHMPGQPEHWEFAKKFTALVDVLLEQKRLKRVPVKIMAGGLGGIAEGASLVTDGKVSGCKLVYRIDDTP